MTAPRRLRLVTLVSGWDIEREYPSPLIANAPMSFPELDELDLDQYQPIGLSPNRRFLFDLLPLLHSQNLEDSYKVVPFASSSLSLTLVGLHLIYAIEH